MNEPLPAHSSPPPKGKSHFTPVLLQVLPKYELCVTLARSR